MEEMIREAAIKKLRELGIRVKETASTDKLEQLLKNNMTAREYDDFVWDLQMSILDLNGSPAY